MACKGSVGSVGQPLEISVEVSFVKGSEGIRNKGMPSRTSLALLLRFV